MAQLSGSDDISAKSGDAMQGAVWSSELDHVPLNVRRKWLLSSKRRSGLGDPKTDFLENESKRKSMPHIDAAVVKRKDEICDLQGVFSFASACPIREGLDQQFTQQQSHEGKIPANSSAVDRSSQKATYGQNVGWLGDCNFQETQIDTYICSDQILCTEANADVAGLDKHGIYVCTFPQNPMLSKVPAKVKVEYSDNYQLGSLGEAICGSAGADLPAVKVKNNIPNDFVDDDLDHIVLKERRRLLLSRKLLELEKPVLQENFVRSSEDLIEHCAGRVNKEIRSVDRESSVAGNQLNEIPENLCRSSVNNSTNSMTAGLSLSTSSMTSVKVKVESMDNNDFCNPDENASSNFSSKILPVKSELEIPDEFQGDWLDHMRLQDRMKLLPSGEVCELNNSRSFEYLRKGVPSALQYSPIVSESAKPVRVNRPRKRKKTATDSVAKAMEEDAPGLLQVLIDQGVSVDEIKLYGEIESDDTLDKSFNEDSFAELEAVISKLFSQRNSLLKFAPIRCTNDSKPSYCLACLFSLVEQARYLQFRKWPVEWGWCRDLKSFIFVFKRHNRIVLERPEYGYATYFFELVDSLPIDWQIKRLVTAMKLTSCGRTSLIENKALSVGEDLTEGEARVLMEYGWMPNTGLGTMLNYCDRVFHDRKNEEKDTSEWRSKIGKLLVDGYNGGSIVSTKIPTKFVECRGADSAEIKLEL